MVDAPTPLAAQADVEAALGRDLTTDEAAKVAAVLAKASALFRAEARQDFTPGRSEVRLKSNGGRIYLPQRPCTEIHSVVDDRDQAITWSRRGQWLTTGLGSASFAVVDYSHGSEEIPELVRLTIAEVGAQVLGLSSEAIAGVTKYTETAGPFSESREYATWAQGGNTTLSPAVIAIARSFRGRVPTIHVSASAPTCDPLGTQLPGYP